MTGTTFILIYSAIICSFVFIVWTFSAAKLHRERINNLKRNDKIRVCSEFDATYLYRVDSKTHRIKIGDTVHDVSSNEIKFVK